MAMQQRRPAQERAWLRSDPPLAEIRARFPQEWQQIQSELGEVIAAGDIEAIKSYASTVARPAKVNTAGQSAEQALLSAEVRQRLAAGLLRQMSVAAATGVTEGKLRFNIINGFLAQRLLFRRGLERKPVSRFWFGLTWPLIWQRRYLMPLVEPKGIYCFYSRSLISRLAEEIGDRSCLEIAAGDGALARFLRQAGADVTATDDFSWKQTRREHTDVLTEDARQALRDRQPEAVICSWPPAGNDFERWVFKTPSVQLYIVIASRHESASGNWNDYRQQGGFDFAEDAALSRLVLPPELESAVYVFRRDQASSGGSSAA